MNSEILSMLFEAADMFVLLAVELTILFLVISYLVGVLQEFISPEKIKSILASRHGKGYVVAALLGAITPFCSCSTIPFLKGLLRARAGFGPMMVFLFASPLLNPIVIGLFSVTFGVNVAIFYFMIAMSVSVTAGVVLDKLGFERYVRKEAYELSADNVDCSATDSNIANKGDLSISNSDSDMLVDINESGEAVITVIKQSRWLRIWFNVWKDFKQVLPYLMISILCGSFIYGFMPTEMITQFAGADKWYAIPIAAVIGIPLYIRASAVIPLTSVLVKKGMAMGSIMALIIGSAGASLTEVILLRSIFKGQMIVAFLAVVLGMAISAGFLYGLLFG